MYHTQAACRAYQQAPRAVPKLVAVVMLYDEVIRQLGIAADCFGQCDYEGHYNAMQKAVRILKGLNAMLDFEQGGQVAERLRSFYVSVTGQVIRATARRDAATLCAHIQRQVVEMRNAWKEVARQQEETLHVEADNKAGRPGSGTSVVMTSL